MFVVSLFGIIIIQFGKTLTFVFRKVDIFGHLLFRLILIVVKFWNPLACVKSSLAN
jgi:hypothetical protein